MQGGIIRGTFFPAIASDVIRINLTMPQGVNPADTDSIITMAEAAVWRVNDRATTDQSDGQQVVENVIKQVGPGTATASLTINLLPGELRDMPSTEIAK